MTRRCFAASSAALVLLTLLFTSVHSEYSYSPPEGGSKGGSSEGRVATDAGASVQREEGAADVTPPVAQEEAPGKPPACAPLTEALGPYSNSVKAGNTLYVSGQLGLTPDKNFAGATIESQTEQVLCNLGAILKAAGGNFSHVVKTTILLADMADFQAVNQLYGERFSAKNTKNPPARATYAVAALPLGGLVEIECVAYVPN